MTYLFSETPFITATRRNRILEAWCPPEISAERDPFGLGVTYALRLVDLFRSHANYAGGPLLRRVLTSEYFGAYRTRETCRGFLAALGRLLRGDSVPPVPSPVPLPFVVRDPLGRIVDPWRLPTETGPDFDYATGCALGRDYAALFVAYVRLDPRANTEGLLGRIVESPQFRIAADPAERYVDPPSAGPLADQFHGARLRREVARAIRAGFTSGLGLALVADCWRLADEPEESLA